MLSVEIHRNAALDRTLQFNLPTEDPAEMMRASGRLQSALVTFCRTCRAQRGFIYGEPVEAAGEWKLAIKNTTGSVTSAQLEKVCVDAFGPNVAAAAAPKKKAAKKAAPVTAAGKDVDVATLAGKALKAEGARLNIPGRSKMKAPALRNAIVAARGTQTPAADSTVTVDNATSTIVDVDKLVGKALKAEATRLDIPGRSKMKAPALRNAIKKAIKAGK